MMNTIKVVLLLLLVTAAPMLAFARGDGDFVLVIDPGHGGKDYGAIGRITNEKSINLAVARLAGKIIDEEFDNVKVVYTRKSDTFVSLKERADIANKADGNLFISIHVNSVAKKSKNRTTVKGASVYTLGLHKSASNLEVAKRENAVIMQESDYSTKYQGFDPNSTESYIVFEMSQNKHMEQSVAFAQEIENELIENAGRADKGVRQAGFWVLWATGMPSVLIELDFICNPSQEKFLASDKGQKQLAMSIVNAFKRYKASYDKSTKAPITENRVSDDGDDNKDKSRQNINKPKKKMGKKSKRDKKATDRHELIIPESTTSAGNDAKANPVAAETGTETKAKTKTGTETETEAKAETEPKKTDSTPDNCSQSPNSVAGKIYKVQFLTSARLYEKGDKSFKGLYPVSSYNENGVWKYTFGEASTWSEAEKILKKIKNKFPDAFIITTRDGKRL